MKPLTRPSHPARFARFARRLLAGVALAGLLALPATLRLHAAPATNEVTALLQRGLLEEESNHNLGLAAQAYEEAVRRHTDEREAAATALFRLAEVQRRLGRTNEATLNYQRLQNEFPEQRALVTLARRQTSAGGGSSDATSAGGSRRQLIAHFENLMAEARFKLVRDELAAGFLKDEKIPAEEKKRRLMTDHATPELTELIGNQNQTAQRLAAISPDFGPEHPERKRLEAVAKTVAIQIQESMEGIQRSLLARPLADRQELDSLQAEIDRALAVDATPATAVDSPATERQRLIREEIALVEKQLTTLRHRITTGAAAPEDEIPLQRQILTLQRELLAAAPRDLTLVPVPAPAGAPAPTAPDDPSSSVETAEIARLRTLLANSPDLLNAPSPELTPLAQAALNGQLAVARFLLAHGAEVNRGDADRCRTPLFQAARNGHKSVVELLLENHAATTPAPNTHLTALHLAARAGHRAVVETLLKAGLDVNVPLERPVESPFPVGPAGSTPLGLAVDGRNQALVELLLAHHADPNLGRAGNYTPLADAVALRELAIATLLLQAGADPNRDEGRYPAVFKAVENKDLAPLQALLAAGARPGITNAQGQSALFLAMPDAVQLLLAKGADPNQVDASGATALHRILQWDAALKKRLNGAELLAPRVSDDSTPYRPDGYDSLAAIKALLAGKADPNKTLPDGTTPLLSAVAQGNAAAVEALLTAGANPDPALVGDAWPLGHAVAYNQTEIAAALLAHKASAKRSYDTIPLLNIASRSGNKRLMTLLLAAGADPNALDQGQGLLPLHYAVLSSRGDLATVLLEGGADPNLRNSRGQSALDLALEKAGGTVSPPPPGIPRPFTQPGIPMAVPPPAQPGEPPVVTITPAQMVDLLRAHGGREIVTQPDAIIFFRPSSRTRVVVASQDPRGWNQPTLLEALALHYNPNTRRVNAELEWPDFREVRINRFGTNLTAAPKVLPVDVSALLNPALAAATDPILEWGDVVEIPELDHPLGRGWTGFMPTAIQALTGRFRQQADIVIHGETNRIHLGRMAPGGGNLSAGENPDTVGFNIQRFWLKSVLSGTGILRASSDVSMIRLRRTAPAGAPERELIVNLGAVNGGRFESDIWLRDGDLIEVPDRKAF